MSLEDVLSKLDSRTRKRVQAASEIAVEKIPTASIGLNAKLGGGFGAGRQTLIYGNKSASKSSSMLQTVAVNQKQGKVCAWIDAENSYDPEWAARLGVNNSELIVSPVKSIDDFAGVGVDLMNAGVDLLIADSISSLLPSTYFVKDKKEEELQEGLDGTRQIGTASKELGVAINKFNYANQNTALVLISQVRNQMNTYGASLKPTGGQAVMFFSSTVIKLWSSASEREQITADITRGDKIIKSPVGREVTYTVEYNKIGPPNQIGTYDFYYAGDNVGIDQIGEVADQAEAMGLIHKGGAWFTYGDNRFQGRAKLVSWLKDNPTICEEIEREINVAS